MAVALANTFDGGTDNTQITTGNSGGASGDAFNSASSDLRYRASDAYASPMCAVNPTANLALVTWSSLSLTGNSLFVRMHMRIASYPGSDQHCFFAFGPSSAQIAGMKLSSTGKLLIHFSGSQTQVGITTTSVPTEQWIRVELEVLVGTVGNARLRLWLYLDPQADTHTEMLDTSPNLGTTKPVDANFYLVPSITYRLDGIALAESKLGKMILPQVPFPTRIAPTAVHRASRW